jgi:dipeptidyl aminopeptidase/acylaminoacyl peptidase
VSYLSCQTKDGKETLDGLYQTPTALANEDGTPKHPIPTVVVIHGGPYHRITDAFDPAQFYWTPALLAAGYGVMMPNYRGGSGHGERFAAYARGGMGNYDEADIVTLTNHVIEKGYADKERLIVSGYSQGGFLSYLSSTRNGLHGLGWKFKAAIPGAGVADWDSMAITSDVGVYESGLMGYGPWGADKDDTTSRLGSALWEMKKAAQKGGVIPPMLILHGEHDVRVPLEQARGFRRGLDFWKLPYEYVTYPREDHTFKEQKHIKDMVERLVAFTDKHLS